jgi:zinc and cadmium transporter
MIPHALEHVQAPPILATVLSGIILFFLLEKLVLWRHCHKEECDIHGRAGPLILFGDAFHNFVDSVVIAAAFLISIPLGVATALAVIAHEVPQEVGDFGIFLDSGYSKQKALLYNTLSSITTLPGLSSLTSIWSKQGKLFPISSPYPQQVSYTLQLPI